MEVYEPKSIKEAIDDLHTFFDCDLYSKFRPEQLIPTGKGNKPEKWYRTDSFPNEKEFSKYLNDHFKLFRKEIIKLIGKKTYLSQEVSKA